MKGSVEASTQTQCVASTRRVEGAQSVYGLDTPDGAAARLGENASTLRSRMKRLGLDPRRFRR
jgi:transcriptional regulator with GAF, ATPase, and Fis domain